MEDWLLTLGWMLAAVAGHADEDPECVVLGGLDSVRTEAVVTGRPGRLLDVYLDESLVLADAEVVEGYAERGLDVRGAALERLSCRVTERDGDRVRLDVVDRLGPTWVVDRDGEQRRLPTDHPSRRQITLDRTGVGWRISAST